MQWIYAKLCDYLIDKSISSLEKNLKNSMYRENKTNINRHPETKMFFVHCIFLVSLAF